MTDLAALSAGVMLGLAVGTVVMIALAAFGAFVVRDVLAVIRIEGDE